MVALVTLYGEDHYFKSACSSGAGVYCVIKVTIRLQVGAVDHHPTDEGEMYFALLLKSIAQGMLRLT